VGNLVYAIQIANGTYRAGSPLDITWSLGFVLFSIATLLPSQSLLPVSNSVQGLSPWPKRVHGTVLASLLFGALASLSWLIFHRKASSDSGVLDTMVAVMALLLIGTATGLRQLLELRQNTHLNRDLQAVNVSLEARVEAAVDGLERRNHELEVQTQEVRRSNEEIRERTHDITLLNELGDLLQMCVSFEEASSVITRMGPHLFANTAGALYLISASRNLVERAAGWGDHDRTEVFVPEECWALRRGREHLVTEEGTAPRCAHLTSDSGGTYLCIPLVAQGEALGLLHLSTANSEAAWQSGSGQRLARTVADAIGLALSNIKLREKLLFQSIRDPLTGLFNRRYLEETLERELSRAVRNNTSIGLIMFDVDHFKRFNDTFGHEAGDLVLKEFGPLIKEHHRLEDIAAATEARSLCWCCPVPALR
jgi:GAF domain-containing protein